MAPKMKYRLDYDLGEEIINVDCLTLVDALEISEALIEKGHKVRLYRLDKNEDGYLMAVLECV